MDFKIYLLVLTLQFENNFILKEVWLSLLTHRTNTHVTWSHPHAVLVWGDELIHLINILHNVFKFNQKGFGDIS